MDSTAGGMAGTDQDLSEFLAKPNETSSSFLASMNRSGGGSSYLSYIRSKYSSTTVVSSSEKELREALEIDMILSREELSNSDPAASSSIAATSEEIEASTTFQLLPRGKTCGGGLDGHFPSPLKVNSNFFLWFILLIFLYCFAFHSFDT